MENPKRPPTRPWRPLEGHQPSQKTGFSGFVPDCITRSGHAGHHWIALDHSYPLIFVSFLQLNRFWSYAQKMQIAKHDQDAKKWSGYICSFTAFFLDFKGDSDIGCFHFLGIFWYRRKALIKTYSDLVSEFKKSPCKVTKSCGLDLRFSKIFRVTIVCGGLVWPLKKKVIKNF